MYDLRPGTHDNTCKRHKYKNENEVCFRSGEVGGSKSLRNTVTSQDARNEDELEIDEGE